MTKDSINNRDANIQAFDNQFDIGSHFINKLPTKKEFKALADKSHSIIDKITEEKSTADMIKDVISSQRELTMAIKESVDNGTSIDWGKINFNISESNYCDINNWQDDPSIYLTPGDAERFLSFSFYARDLFDNLAFHVVQDISVTINKYSPRYIALTEEQKKKVDAKLENVVHSINDVLEQAIRYYIYHGGAAVVKTDIQDFNTDRNVYKTQNMRKENLPVYRKPLYAVLPLETLIPTGFYIDPLKGGNLLNISSLTYVPRSYDENFNKPTGKNKNTGTNWLVEPIIVKDRYTPPYESVLYRGFSAPLVAKKFHLLNAIRIIHKVIINSIDLCNILNFKDSAALYDRDYLDISPDDSSGYDITGGENNGFTKVRTSINDQVRVENFQFQQLQDLLTYYVSLARQSFGIYDPDNKAKTKDNTNAMPIFDIIFNNAIQPLVLDILYLEFENEKYTDGLPPLSATNDFIVNRPAYVELLKEMYTTLALLGQGLTTLNSSGGEVLHAGDVHVMLSNLLKLPIDPELANSKKLYPFSKEKDPNTKTNFNNVTSDAGSKVSVQGGSTGTSKV